MARPSKFSESVGAVIVRGVSIGLPVKVAASLAGVSSSTVHEWLRWGKSNRSPALASFTEQVNRARAEAVCEAVGTIWRAGDKDWKAAAKWLELLHPAEFGPNRGD